MRIKWDDGEIEVDVATLETHRSGAEVTEHNVERGSPITDHVRPKAVRLTLECLVSNHPIRQPATQMDGVSGEVRSTELSYRNLDGSTGKTSITALVWTGKFNRVKTVYALIAKLVETGVLVTITTELREYESMVLTDLSVPRDAATGDAIKFNVDAVQVTIVEAKEVDDPVPRRRRKKNGKQAATETKKDEQRRSVLTNLAKQFAPGLLPGK